jgi:Ca2+-binding EF-hand superfamily protein
MKPGIKTFVPTLLGTLALLALPVFADPASDRHFAMMDVNGDGRISRAEHATAAKRMFAECDANRDGIVTAAEMDASTARQGVKPAADDKNSAEKIAVIDRDQDGKLSAAEHEAGTESMFGRMDLNRDAFLSQEEVEAGMRLMKKGVN